jgi:hypothetical protein
MLMSQPTNATKPLRMTVMMGLMMLPLLWRRQMKQGKEGRRARRARKLGPRGRTSIILFFLVLSLLTPSPLPVGRHGLIVNKKTKLRMPREPLLVSSRVYFFYSI